MDTGKIERTIARHVKPLLDALERSHDISDGLMKGCQICELIAAWRAKPE